MFSKAERMAICPTNLSCTSKGDVLGSFYILATLLASENFQTKRTARATSTSGCQIQQGYGGNSRYDILGELCATVLLFSNGKEGAGWGLEGLTACLSLQRDYLSSRLYSRKKCSGPPTRLDCALNCRCRWCMNGRNDLR